MGGVGLREEIFFIDKKRFGLAKKLPKSILNHDNGISLPPAITGKNKKVTKYYDFVTFFIKIKKFSRLRYCFLLHY